MKKTTKTQLYYFMDDIDSFFNGMSPKDRREVAIELCCYIAIEATPQNPRNLAETVDSLAILQEARERSMAIIDEEWLDCLRETLKNMSDKEAVK